MTTIVSFVLPAYEWTRSYIRLGSVKQRDRTLAVWPSDPASFCRGTDSQTLTEALFTAVGITLGHVSHNMEWNLIVSSVEYRIVQPRSED